MGNMQDVHVDVTKSKMLIAQKNDKQSIGPDFEDVKQKKKTLT